MKTLLLATLLLSGAASAETITLSPTPGFGNLQEFLNVPNDRALDINIFSGEIDIDGVAYKKVGATYQTDAGAVLTATLDIVPSLVCVKSGKGQRCGYRYALVSGSIVR